MFRTLQRYKYYLIHLISYICNKNSTKILHKFCLDANRLFGRRFFYVKTCQIQKKMYICNVTNKKSWKYGGSNFKTKSIGGRINRRRI